MPNKMTKDPTELWKRWAHVYLNIMILTSKNPIMRKKLDQLQEKAVELNEFFSEFPGVNP